ncbi:hypothetical protein CYMTET_4637 [Cymbomonas tetramitiformis]|uniref:STAS domain-containing protein n=1 Tax=Cymbomonas tetramitiformis TaxID=36881 RepID=A0AAE0H0Z9_9CHLO|nr:hypothetical protein CYMTET_4637 [Cymbomonas tetramitiformis]
MSEQNDAQQPSEGFVTEQNEDPTVMNERVIYMTSMSRDGAEEGGDEASEEGDQAEEESLNEGVIGAYRKKRKSTAKPLIDPDLFDIFSECRGKDPKDVFYRILETCVPATKWLRTYDHKAYLQDDLIAGLTVGIMIVPQSMAYALIAGLPTQYGLYSSIIPIYIYALFGSSRQLAVGPVALVSLLVEAGLRNLGVDEDDEEEYAAYAHTLAFLCGMFQIFLGIFRLGFIIDFLSHAVVSGFTSGAAVTIGLSQLKYLVGYKIEKSSSIYDTLSSAIKGIDDFQVGTFIMGSIWITMLLTFKHLGKTYPKLKMLRALGPLIVVVLSTMIVGFTRWNEQGMEVVGTIPSGFPPFTNDHKWDKTGEVLGTAVTISFVGFMESIAIAKSLAAKHKYELDSNMELSGIGLSNAIGSFFGGYPITGSFSRSAVNNETGAKSGVAALVTASMVVFALLLLTEAMYFLPKNALAAIVMSAVLGLIDTDEVAFLWKVSKKDLSTWVISFLGVLFLGVELGIAIAVSLSLVLVIYESARPHTAELGKLPNTTVYRNIRQYEDAATVEGMIILRIDAPIYFANTSYVKEKLRQYEMMASMKPSSTNNLRGQELRFVILEMSPVTSIDSTGLHALKDIVSEYKLRGIGFVLANPNRKVLEALEQAGIMDKIGFNHIFLNVHFAVEACRKSMLQEDEAV